MFEKEAEEYAEKKICQENNGGCMGFDKCKEYCERYHNTQKYWKDGAEFGYNKGLEAGRPKWHNLRKNPKDVPLIEGRYLCILDYNLPAVLMYADDRLGHFVWVADDGDIYDGCVSRWAEIPKFKEEA